MTSLCPFLWYRRPKAAIRWLEDAFGFETRLLIEDPETGSVFAARAVALDPNLVMARLCASWAELYLGHVDVAIERWSARSI